MNDATCSCHVHYLPGFMQRTARRGAHGLYCGMYRESLDPADRRNDHNERNHWADLNCATCFGLEWLASNAADRAADTLARRRAEVREFTVKRATLFDGIVETYQTEAEANGHRATQGRML